MNIENTSNLIKETNISSFLAPYEKNRVESKYENSSFEEVFEDLKNNNNDAILYIMSKFDSLLNMIFLKNMKKIGSQSDFGSILRPEDWKNEVYIYLSGAGIAQPFYEIFKIPQENPTEEHKWRAFALYLKYYLMDYFRRVSRQYRQQMKPSTSSLNVQDVHYTKEKSSKEKIDNLASEVTDSTALQKLFAKFLILLKEYADTHKTWGKSQYAVIALRTKGKSFKEISKLLKMTLSNAYKQAEAAKKRWIKFLNAHKSGRTPKKLETKHTPISVKG